jgi:quinol monooxygenase YgiN
MDTRQLLVLGATMMASLSSPAVAQHAGDPYVRLAEIEIDPAQLDAYKAAVNKQIHAAVQSEPGVLALYAVADKDNPALVFVFEMYADIDAYRAHLETEHFKAYKRATQNMVRSLKLRETMPILLGAKPR